MNSRKAWAVFSFVSFNPVNIVLSILHMLYKCLLNARLLCQEKQNLRRGNGMVVSPGLTCEFLLSSYVGREPWGRLLTCSGMQGLGDGLRVGEMNRLPGVKCSDSIPRSAWNFRWNYFIIVAQFGAFIRKSFYIRIWMSVILLSYQDSAQKELIWELERHGFDMDNILYCIGLLRGLMR